MRSMIFGAPFSDQHARRKGRRLMIFARFILATAPMSKPFVSTQARVRLTHTSFPERSAQFAFVHSVTKFTITIRSVRECSPSLCFT